MNSAFVDHRLTETELDILEEGYKLTQDVFRTAKKRALHREALEVAVRSLRRWEAEQGEGWTAEVPSKEGWYWAATSNSPMPVCIWLEVTSKGLTCFVPTGETFRLTDADPETMWMELNAPSLPKARPSEPGPLPEKKEG